MHFENEGGNFKPGSTKEIASVLSICHATAKKYWNWFNVAKMLNFSKSEYWKNNWVYENPKGLKVASKNEDLQSLAGHMVEFDG